MKNRKAMALEQRLQRRQTEVKNVLMINGIELAVFDEIRRVGKFQDDTAMRLEQSAKSANEIIGIRRVGKDIVAEDQIRLPVRCNQSLRDRFSKKFHEGLDAFRFRNFRDIFRRFNAKASDTGGFEILQEISVVTGDFDHKTLRRQAEFFNVPFG